MSELTSRHTGRTRDAEPPELRQVLDAQHTLLSADRPKLVVEPSWSGISSALTARAAILDYAQLLVRDLDAEHAHPPGLEHADSLEALRPSRNLSLTLASVPRQPGAGLPTTDGPADPHWQRLEELANTGRTSWPGREPLSGHAALRTLGGAASMVQRVALLDHHVRLAAWSVGAERLVTDALGTTETWQADKAAQALLRTACGSALGWRGMPAQADLPVLHVDTGEDFSAGLQRLTDQLADTYCLSPQHAAHLMAAQKEMASLLAGRPDPEMAARGREPGSATVTALREHADRLARLPGLWPGQVQPLLPSDDRSVRQADECLAHLQRGVDRRSPASGLAADLVASSRALAGVVDRVTRGGRWAMHATRSGDANPSSPMAANTRTGGWAVTGRLLRPAFARELRSAVTPARVLAEPARPSPPGKVSPPAPRR